MEKHSTLAQIEERLNRLYQEVDQHGKTLDIVVTHIDSQIEDLIYDMERTLKAHNRMVDFKDKVVKTWYAVDSSVAKLEKRLDCILKEAERQ